MRACVVYVCWGVCLHLQATLEPAQVKACVLVWHVLWGDLGAADCTGDSVTLQVHKRGLLLLLW